MKLKNLTVMVSLIPFGLLVIHSIDAQRKENTQSSKATALLKLQSMAGRIRLGMSRSEVEKLLGSPTYCPSVDSCNYAVAAEDEKGIPFGLVVSYVRLGYSEGEKEQHTGKLEEYWVGRVVE